MRTTLDIDADLLEKLRERAFRTGKSFKETVNAALRRGTQSEGVRSRKKRYKCPSAALGKARVNLDKALALASEAEDDEVVRDLQLRK